MAGAGALQVFVLLDGQLLASEVFGDGDYTIGSNTTSDLILPHERVSARHATLKVRDGRAALVDEDSDLGTIVNGQAVREVLLSSADEIYVGPFLLKIRPLARRPVADLPPANRVRRPTPLMPTPLPGGYAAAARAVPVARAPAPALQAAPRLEVVDKADRYSHYEKTTPDFPTLTNELRDLPEVTAEPLELEALKEAPPQRTRQPASPMPARRVAPSPPKAVPATQPREKKPAGRRADRLFVRIYWGTRLLSVHSYKRGHEVVAASSETAALSLHAFNLTEPTALAKPSRGGWTLHPPPGAMISFRESGGTWRAAPTRARQYLLPAGIASRMTVGAVHVEFACATPPASMHWRFGRFDPVFAAIVLPLLVGGVLLVRRMPHFPKESPQVEERRFTKYVQAMQERAKQTPKKKEEEPAPKVVERKPEPKPIAQAESLKMADASLKTVERVAKASRQIDSLLDSLQKVTIPTRGGRRDALAGLGSLPDIPAIGNMESGSHGIGDLGGPSGPLTKGLAALGDVGGLGAGTAGTGNVRGVPVKVPKRPSQVQGQIDRDALARVINEHVDEMRGCYERALLKDPNIGAGKVTLEWTIGPGGDVVDIGTKASSLRSNEVVTCLLSVVRALQFPKPDGGVVIVSYPILFNSVGY